MQASTVKQIAKPHIAQFSNMWECFSKTLPDGDSIDTVYAIEGTSFYVTRYSCKRCNGHEVGYRFYRPCYFEGELWGYKRTNITPNGKQREDSGYFNLGI
jgi:hypothetical protein